MPRNRVILNWTPRCGDCFNCARDRPALRETNTPAIWAGTMNDGGTRVYLDGHPICHLCSLGCFSEYVVVRTQACIIKEHNVPPHVAALIGCAVATGIGTLVHTAGIEGDSSAAVFRAGPSGCPPSCHCTRPRQRQSLPWILTRSAGAIPSRPTSCWRIRIRFLPFTA